MVASRFVFHEFKPKLALEGWDVARFERRRLVGKCFTGVAGKSVASNVERRGTWFQVAKLSSRRLPTHNLFEREIFKTT